MFSCMKKYPIVKMARILLSLQERKLFLLIWDTSASDQFRYQKSVIHSFVHKEIYTTCSYQDRRNIYGHFHCLLYSSHQSIQLVHIKKGETNIKVNICILCLTMVKLRILCFFFQLSFTFGLLPSVLLIYIGQAAYLRKHMSMDIISNAFFNSIPSM
jgi:hypothetical protein